MDKDDGTLIQPRQITDSIHETIPVILVIRGIQGYFNPVNNRPLRLQRVIYQDNP